MERQFYDEWEGFKPGRWSNTSINLRDFIQKNFTPYDGDDSFLTGPTEATTKLWEQVMELSKKEREAGGVLDMDTKIVSTITSHGPGYLNKDLEKIVGFQTDKPFKRSLQPFGGIRMAMNACEQNGYTVDPEVVKIFTEYRKTHNQGVFDAYGNNLLRQFNSRLVNRTDLEHFLLLCAVISGDFRNKCGNKVCKFHWNDLIFHLNHFIKAIAFNNVGIIVDCFINQFCFFSFCHDF